MRQILTAIFFLVVVIAAGLGVARWSQRNADAQLEIATFETPEEAMAKVRELLAENTEESAKKALKIITRYSDDILGKSATSMQWEDLFVTACLKAKGYKALLQMYEVKNSIIDNREQASIIIADALIMLKRTDDYRSLRAAWQNRSAQPARWFLYDASALITDGQEDEAIQHLASEEFEGQDETDRLVRMAILVGKSSASKAWKILEEARKKAPKNTDIRVLRARLLELMDQKEHAIAELRAAIEIAPEDPILHDQLAELFRRHKQTAAAILSWKEALKHNPPSYITLKMWFWNKVFSPADLDWPEVAQSKDPTDHLLSYYLTLEENEWWNKEELDNRGNLGKFLNNNESTLWLRVIDHLSKGEEIQALKLLQHKPLETSKWAPELHLGLLRILTYRLEGFLPEPGIASTSEIQHPFFTQIDDATRQGTIENPTTVLPSEINRLIKGDFAFTGAFLATGWLEAAYQLSPSDIVPPQLPTWISYGMTQAIRHNQSPEEALLYAYKQTPNDALTLLTSEILIEQKDTAAAYQSLQEIAVKRTRVGLRAAYLMTQLDMLEGRFEQAMEILDTHTHLSETVLGKETRARIHLAQGERERTREIYTSIQNESIEAVSYLVKEAYDQGNLKRAKELTAKLLARYPNNQVLRKNFIKLVKELEEGQPE